MRSRLSDAATFVLSAATLVALPFAEPPPARKEHHFLREVSAGITHIARHRVLRQLTIGVAAALLVVGFSETLLFAITSALHRRTVVHRRHRHAAGHRRDRRRRHVCLADAPHRRRAARRARPRRSSAIGDALWLFPRVWVVLPATAIAGLGIVWAVVALGTAYQRRSPTRRAGPRRRRRQHAPQRAADDLDRARAPYSSRSSTTG